MTDGQPSQTCDCCAPDGATALASAERRVADLIAQTAATHTAAGERIGTPAAVVDQHHEIVNALDTLDRLQRSVPGQPTGFALARIGDPDAPPIACTLDGGIDAMRDRIGEWQRVVGRATGRHPLDHGVVLTYDHDADLTVELARLAAAEFACCSFFEFSLTVGPGGMSFAVTAPEDARDVVTAMFGAYGAQPAGAR